MLAGQHKLGEESTGRTNSRRVVALGVGGHNFSDTWKQRYIARQQILKLDWNNSEILR